ncbi:MAG: IPT/TIG domain-containing protein [Pyrinomonadaceae bacterium]|nr:IPT/TIG domain-containing protein [Pyrinomonadaceae bacterium]
MSKKLVIWIALVLVLEAVSSFYVAAQEQVGNQMPAAPATGSIINYPTPEGDNSQIGNQDFPIPDKGIATLIESLTEGRTVREITRIFWNGALVENPALAEGLLRLAGNYNPEARILLIKGILNGQKVIEEVRFLVLDEETVIVKRDIYLDGASADLSIGRSLPFSLDENARESNAAVAAPVVYSMGGVTNSSSGISNGRVSMSCGASWNGNFVINDKPSVYQITINGNNFGTTRGTVTIAGRNAPILSWSNTTIKIDPTLDWWASPMSAVLRISTASGTYLNWGIDVVPAISSRIYGQCTYHVAYQRKQMGMQPSPTAYGGYTAIAGNYIPRRGDQYQWGSGDHTGIVTAVSAPVSSSGGIKTWNITISEQNADCRNGLKTYTAQFQTKTVNGITTVMIYPKSSVSSYSGAKLYYPPVY